MMTPVASPSKMRYWLGAVLGLLAGVWGVTVMLVFALSQVRMIGPGIPIAVVFDIEGGGLMFLGLQAFGYAACAAMALLSAANKVRHRRWLWLMLAFSLVTLGLSLIPFSSVGLFTLPAALGLLASCLVLWPLAGR